MVDYNMTLWKKVKKYDVEKKKQKKVEISGHEIVNFSGRFHL